jgi:triosephosphate isomerase
MRTPLLVANWKMNHTVIEALKFISFFQNIPFKDQREIVLCPPFTSLYSLSVVLADQNRIKLGAQNCHFEAKGAYTGEISPVFLREVNCDYVIVGHSERRQLFKEEDATIAQKLTAVAAHEMAPIFCVGETEQERKDEQTFTRIEMQLSQGLKHYPSKAWDCLVIAYEPVWAIGTGNNATPKQAQEVHAFIRQWLSKNFGKKTASLIRILYGGSVKPDNISILMAQEDIDGALVGGASLLVDSFAKIVNY